MRGWGWDMAAGFAAALISILCCWWVMDLRHSDIHVPYHYEYQFKWVGTHDNLHVYAGIKALQELGIRADNPYLGAPLTQNAADAAQNDWLHVLILRGITLVCPDFGSAVNVFFLLSFALIGASAYAAFRAFSVDRWLAIVFAVLYACLPYHFIRGQAHLFLSCYYVVPLSAMVCIWAFLGESFGDAGQAGWRLTRRGRIAVLVCFLSGVGGIYYAFFTLMFLAMTIVVRRVRHGRLQACTSAILGLCVTLMAAVVPMIPPLVYRMRHGANPEAIVRPDFQAELYNLRIVQLLLPVFQHRILLLARITNKYFNGTWMVHESTSVTLGLVGSIGFLTLVAWLLGIRLRSSNARLLTCLAYFTGAGLLFTTFGGFGTLASVMTSPLLRSSNRICVFLAIFSFLALAVLLTRLRERFADRHWAGLVWLGFGVVLLVGGLLDQTSPNMAPDHVASRVAFNRDRDFVRKIQRCVPEGSMIFQLPYVKYPEGGAGDGELFRGYLHSHGLRWSYGAVAGREADQWERAIEGINDKVEYLNAIRQVGFAGIYLDRSCMPQDPVPDMTATGMFGSPVSSSDGRLVFMKFVDGVK